MSDIDGGGLVTDLCPTCCYPMDCVLLCVGFPTAIRYEYTKTFSDTQLCCPSGWEQKRPSFFFPKSFQDRWVLAHLCSLSDVRLKQRTGRIEGWKVPKAEE